MVSFGGKLDWTWNKLKGKTLDIPVRDFLYQIICSWTTHLQYDPSQRQPTCKKEEKGDCAFCLFAFTLLASSSTYYCYILLLMSEPSFFTWTEDQWLSGDSSESARLVLLRSKASMIGSSNFPE